MPSLREGSPSGTTNPILESEVHAPEFPCWSRTGIHNQLAYLDVACSPIRPLSIFIPPPPKVVIAVSLAVAPAPKTIA